MLTFGFPGDGIRKERDHPAADSLVKNWRKPSEEIGGRRVMVEQWQPKSLNAFRHQGPASGVGSDLTIPMI